MFTLEDHDNARTLDAHAQCIILYPLYYLFSQASLEHEEQPARYETTYHLLESMTRVRKKCEEFRVPVKWLGSRTRDEEAGEPIGAMK